MSDLIVRRLEPEVVQALKHRAAAHGVSAEAEHRAILRAVLLKPGKRSLAEVLQAIPEVGEDSDFERVQGEQRVDNVFD